MLALSGLFEEIGVAAITSARALPINELENSYRQYTGFVCKAYRDLRTAFNEMALGKDDEDRVYIVGS